jgi:hypothetical protein
MVCVTDTKLNDTWQLMFCGAGGEVSQCTVRNRSDFFFYLRNCCDMTPTIHELWGLQMYQKTVCLLGSKNMNLSWPQQSRC